MNTLFVPMFHGQANVKLDATSLFPQTDHEQTSLDNAFLNMLASLLHDKALPVLAEQSASATDVQIDDSVNADTVNDLFNAEWTAEQLMRLLTGLAQMVTNLAQTTGDPELGQLAQQMNPLFHQHQAHAGTGMERQTHERVLAQLAELLERLPVQEKQLIVRQLLSEIHDMESDSQSRAALKGADGATAKNDADSDAEIHKLPLLRETSGKETRRANVSPGLYHGGSLENGHRAVASHLQQQGATGVRVGESASPQLAPQLVRGEAMALLSQGTQLTRADVTPTPQQGTLPMSGEAAMNGGGELTEATAFRAEGTMAVSSNHAASFTSARPVVWMADAFSESLQQHIVRHLSVNPHGVSHARLSLYPENLGQVDVRITSHNGVVTAHLVADTWLAKEVLEAQLDQLRQTLQNQGMQVNKLEVSVGQHGSLAKPFSDQHEGVQGHSHKQDQRNASANIVESYLESDTSQVESWRNPHASVSYSV